MIRKLKKWFTPRKEEPPDYIEYTGMDQFTDSMFLDWVADRLVHVYGESPHLDYVHRLRRMAARLRK